MTDQQLVNRIANVYYEKYTKEGYASALAYSDRVFRGNPELRDGVKKAIQALLKKKGITK